MMGYIDLPEFTIETAILIAILGLLSAIVGQIITIIIAWKSWKNERQLTQQGWKQNQNLLREQMNEDRKLMLIQWKHHLKDEKYWDLIKVTNEVLHHVELIENVNKLNIKDVGKSKENLKYLMMFAWGTLSQELINNLQKKIQDYKKSKNQEFDVGEHQEEPVIKSEYDIDFLKEIENEILIHCYYFIISSAYKMDLSKQRIEMIEKDNPTIQKIEAITQKLAIHLENIWEIKGEQDTKRRIILLILQKLQNQLSNIKKDFEDLKKFMQDDLQEDFKLS